MENAANSQDEQSRRGFEPYRSVLRFRSTPSLDDQNPSEGENIDNQKFQAPPWRRRIGAAYFLLSSEFAEYYGEAISEDEADYYAELLERTFGRFSDKKVGSNPDLFCEVDLSLRQIEVGAWTVDEAPMPAWVEGDMGVVYAEAGKNTSHSG